MELMNSAALFVLRHRLVNSAFRDCFRLMGQLITYPKGAVVPTLEARGAER
jgi:hypothetical protein